MAVMTRPQTVVELCVPWGEHGDVYEMLRFLSVALASDGVPVRSQLAVLWTEPNAAVRLGIDLAPDAAVEAVRRAVQDAPRRVASVDVINDDDGGA